MTPTQYSPASSVHGVGYYQKRDTLQEVTIMISRIATWPDGTTVELYIGTADEVRKLYSKIRRAERRGQTNLFTLWADRAEFNPNKRYALQIDGVDYSIITADTLADYLADGMNLSRCGMV